MADKVVACSIGPAYFDRKGRAPAECAEPAVFLDGYFPVGIRFYCAAHAIDYGTPFKTRLRDGARIQTNEGKL
jgi:hypothetical protein